MTDIFEGKDWLENSCHPIVNPPENTYCLGSAFNQLRLIPDQNHSTVHKFDKSHSKTKEDNYRSYFSLVNFNEIEAVCIKKPRSLPNLHIDINGKENVKEFESKYCRTNPLYNVPWAKENVDRSEEIFESTRFESPTVPDLTNWAALFLENNPSY